MQIIEKYILYDSKSQNVSVLRLERALLKFSKRKLYNTLYILSFLVSVNSLLPYLEVNTYIVLNFSKSR